MDIYIYIYINVLVSKENAEKTVWFLIRRNVKELISILESFLNYSDE